MNKIPEGVVELFPDQSARDAAPTVAPREGCMGLMRNGDMVGPFWWAAGRSYPWATTGECFAYDGRYNAMRRDRNALDIIAVWPPSEPQPPADPLDTVRAAIRGLSDADMEEMIFQVFGLWGQGPYIGNELRTWAKGERE